MSQEITAAVVAAAGLIIASLIGKVRPRTAGLVVVVTIAVAGLIWSIEDFRVELYDANNTEHARNIWVNKAYCWRTQIRITGNQKADCELREEPNGWHFYIYEQGGRLDARGHCEMRCLL